MFCWSVSVFYMSDLVFFSSVLVLVYCFLSVFLNVFFIDIFCISLTGLCGT